MFASHPRSGRQHTVAAAVVPGTRRPGSGPLRHLLDRLGVPRRALAHP
jgi:hypothetical protein